MIEESVRKFVIIDNDVWDSNMWTSYLSPNIAQHFWFYNLTNPYEVQVRSGKPKFELFYCRYRKYVQKYDWEFLNDKKSFKWHEYRWHTPDTGWNDICAHQTITTVNPVYIGTAGGFGGKESSVISTLASRAVSRWNVQLITNTSSPLQWGLRALLLRNYLIYANNTLGTFLGWTQAQIATQWSGGQTAVATTYSSIQNITELAGFELSTTAQQITIPQAEYLLNSANNYALTSLSGVRIWSTFFNDPHCDTTGTCTAAVTALIADATIGHVRHVIRAWARAITAASNTAYLTVVRTRVMASASALACSDWSCLGALQFGEGVLSQAIAGVDSIASLGLDNSIAYLPRPPEYYGLCTGIGLSTTALTVTQATSFATVFSNMLLLGNFWNTITAGGDPSTIPTYLATGYTSVALLSNFGAYFKLVGEAYVQWPEVIGYRDGALPDNGLGTENKGLFIQTTPNKLLLGYTSGFLELFNAQLLAGFGLTADFAGFLPPQLYNRSHARFLQPPNGPIVHQIKTGKENINTAHTIELWRNLTSFWDRDEIRKQNSASFEVCYLYATQPTGTYPAGNCKVWRTPEHIANQSVSFGGQYVPFREPQRSRSDRIRLFSPEVMRVANLTFVKDISIKGIWVRRYEVDMYSMANETTNPLNSKYYHEGPDQLWNAEPIYDAPIWLSLPRFGRAPNYVKDPFQDFVDYDNEKHMMWLGVEPLSGKPFIGYKQIQFNFKLTRTMFDLDAYAKVFTNYTTIYWPLAIAREFGVVSDENAAGWDMFVYKSRLFSLMFMCIFLIIAPPMLCLTIYKWFLFSRAPAMQKPSPYAEGGAAVELVNSAGGSHAPPPTGGKAAFRRTASNARIFGSNVGDESTTGLTSPGTPRGFASEARRRPGSALLSSSGGDEGSGFARRSSVGNSAESKREVLV